MTASASSPPVREWLLRARLASRDGLEGDRREAERLGARVFPAAAEPERPEGILREAAEGARTSAGRSSWGSS